jgi:5-deoxy-D-glucuronate isomerase
MLKFKPPVVLQLQEGQLIRCDQAGRATTIRVVCGRVWVTQSGDRRDYFLRPGATLVVAAGSQALLGAESDAQVSFTAAPTWARGVAAGAAGRIGRLGRLAARLVRAAAPRPATG